jgi:hypothetical protein
MKPLSPHDPRNDAFDDLIAAALHGELTPEERAQFEARLNNDPAAQAAYQEAQAMHDLLEKTHKSAQPDPAFEQRMVSGIRRKLQHEPHRETAWESLHFFWKWTRGQFCSRWGMWQYTIVSSLVVVVVGFSFALYHDVKILSSLNRGWSGPTAPPSTADLYFPPSLYNGALGIRQTTHAPELRARALALEKADSDGRALIDAAKAQQMPVEADKERSLADANTYSSVTTASANGGAPQGADMSVLINAPTTIQSPTVTMTPAAPAAASMPPAAPPTAITRNGLETDIDELQNKQQFAQDQAQQGNFNVHAVKIARADKAKDAAAASAPNAAPSPADTTAIDTRKLIRNAQLDLEVKSFQAAMDQITAMTKAAGGYVDTSNSQKGGNGKLQGTVVVKVLPQNLDAFLLKLRDLGGVQNQSVSTDDVTKDYYDTQARLDNSRRMEEQLQDLLKHANSKVSDLLAVERELGRVRGDIEQMQGQLKLYDFEVQYATVTMQLREKDLNQAAAYLLREQDDFSLFATDVEGTFQKARQTADDFKAQILVANLVHNSGSDVSAELTVMVAPDQIEPFLAQVRSLGRVANFTRQTQRVARDGGDSNEPADQALTEKDKVQVHLAIRSDDETRKQVALTVVAKAVDDALDQAKAAALANAGVEILNSSLNKTPQGQSTAQLTVRVPGKDDEALIAAFKALGRTASLSIQRNDNSGPGASGDDAPVIVSLSLTDDDTPLQETEMSVLAADVDDQAQQIKKDAAAAGVEVKGSSFERQPDGIESAQMTFRLPMSKYPAFLESLKQLGKVESLSVRRDDRPDQTVADNTAPAEISLQLHNQGEIVPDNNGLWATLRQTFGDGATALFGSVRVIGVVIAFLVPWVFTLVLLAWVGRRIYVGRRK